MPAAVDLRTASRSPYRDLKTALLVGIPAMVIVAVATWAITAETVGGVRVVEVSPWADRPITGDPIPVPPSSTPAAELALEPCPSWARTQFANGALIDDALTAAGPALPLWSEFPLPEFNVSTLTDVRGSGSILPVQADGVNFLTPPRVVITTDLDNEFDDWPAVIWALLGSVGDAPSLSVEAIYIEPFSFRWQTVLKVIAYKIEQKPEEEVSGLEAAFLAVYQTTLDNMRLNGFTPQTWVETDNHAIWCPERSIAESLASTQRLVGLLAQAGGDDAEEIAALADTPILAGSTAYLTGSDPSVPLESDAVSDLIARGRAVTDPANDPLYVVCIGAPTNIAAALLQAPDLVQKIIVVWDGAWPSDDETHAATGSFNAGSDPLALRVLFGSGVPLIFAPGFPSLMDLQLSRPEVEAWLSGRGPVSDAIYTRFLANPDLQPYGIGEYNEAGTSRIQWDIGCMVPFIAPGLLTTVRQPAVDIVQVAASCNGLFNSCEGVRPSYDSSGSGGGGVAIATSCATPNLDGASCRDGYFYPADPPRPDLIEIQVYWGIASPTSIMRDLLVKLQAAGL